jgi:hypothetical protein
MPQNVLAQQVLSEIHLSDVSGIRMSVNPTLVVKILAVLILLEHTTVNVSLDVPETQSLAATVHQ